jgi:hypothetical protein
LQDTHGSGDEHQNLAMKVSLQVHCAAGGMYGLHLV